MAEQKYGLEKLLADIERDAQSVQRGISGVGGGFADTLRRDYENTRAFWRSDASLASQIQPDFSPRGGPRSVATAPQGMTSAQRNAMIQDKRRDYAGLAAPEAAPDGGGMGGGAGMNPISALFAPMFADLRRQRQLANQRYEANSQQVTNIYGQITGARSADKAATETAFQRLVDAASTRSTAVNTGIDASEAARLQQNQAALQGMGLGELSTSQGDIASQTAAQAQQTNLLNSANWENMLRAMGATAGQQVDADVAGFNYAMAEDLGRLRGAREEFAQELGKQRFELKSKKAQAAFDYQQAQQKAAAAAAAAVARATNAADRAAAGRAQDLLDKSDPLTKAISRGVELGFIDFDPVKVQDAYNGWMVNRGTKPTAAGRTSWNKGSAIADALDYVKDQLSNDEKRALQEAIGNSY
jgi:hypothetical protein